MSVYEKRFVKEIKDGCECGGTRMCDTGMILTSNPPQYRIECEDCGKVTYIFCSELSKHIKCRFY